jgi:hypothetical protein
MPTDGGLQRSAGASRQRALARWENEGGALGGDRDRSAAGNTDAELPPLADAELMQLRIRVIALENLLVALLAKASAEEIRAIREMAGFIAPRPGFTPHKLTTHAESHMRDLVERATRFGAGEPRD